MAATRVQRVKNHFRENWKYYAIGGACLLVGSVVTYGVTRQQALSKVSVDPKVDVKYNWKPNVTQNVIVTFEERSNLSKPVHLVGTDRYFNSQSEAAKQLGISKALLSKHLNGSIDDVNGLRFEWLVPTS